MIPHGRTAWSNENLNLDQRQTWDDSVFLGGTIGTPWTTTSTRLTSEKQGIPPSGSCLETYRIPNRSGGSILIHHHFKEQSLAIGVKTAGLRRAESTRAEPTRIALLIWHIWHLLACVISPFKGDIVESNQDYWAMVKPLNAVSRTSRPNMKP